MVRLLLAVATTLLLVTLAGCSSKGSAGAEVAIHNFSYDPASVTVASGGKVTFVNHDSAQHSATADGGAFDVTIAGDGGEAEVDVSPGTYQYHCKFHSSMRGTLVVS